MRKILSLGFIFIVFLSACESSAGNQVVPPPVTNSSPVTAQPQSNPVLPNDNFTGAQPNQPANSSVALNPKHGQPGHRCDIPEGAPLNSPAANQPMSIQQPAPANPILSQPVMNQSAGNVKLNPPHGQPGHDCTIAVGQPLKK